MVRSKTQRPSLVIERKKNIENVATWRLSTGDIMVVSRERIVSAAVGIVVDAGESCHSARTTGILAMSVGLDVSLTGL